VDYNGFVFLEKLHIVLNVENDWCEGMKVFMAKLNEMMECTICFKEMLMTTPILKGTLTERLLKEKKREEIFFYTCY
jgi:hypothetical protein